MHGELVEFAGYLKCVCGDLFYGVSPCIKDGDIFRMHDQDLMVRNGTEDRAGGFVADSEDLPAI